MYAPPAMLWRKILTHRLAIDGDDYEKLAWGQFLQTEFPSYELFWLKHVVPLTNRPKDIHSKDDTALAAIGKNAEDLAIAQLHYTVLRHLIGAQKLRQTGEIDDFGLFVGLSCLCAAQDVAFELLQRYTKRGNYDPWLERSPAGKRKNRRLAGQDAQNDWQNTNKPPLTVIRDYRNKLMHGRIPPATRDAGGLRLPGMNVVRNYCDWRLVTDPINPPPPGDFEYTNVIFRQAWQQTVAYFESMWQKHLL